jgi:hypothetical protein
LLNAQIYNGRRNDYNGTFCLMDNLMR